MAHEVDDLLIEVVGINSLTALLFQVEVTEGGSKVTNALVLKVRFRKLFDSRLPCAEVFLKLCYKSVVR